MLKSFLTCHCLFQLYYLLKKHLNNTCVLPIICEIIGSSEKMLAIASFPCICLCGTPGDRLAPRIVSYIFIAINLIFHANAVAGGGYDCTWLARLSPLQQWLRGAENRNPVFGGPIIVKVVANLFLGHRSYGDSSTDRPADQDILWFPYNQRSSVLSLSKWQ